jgi:TonB family protein
MGLEPGPEPGARPAREGAGGQGVTGNINLKGRRVIHRPDIVLPERYSRMGRGYSVGVEFVVAPEGLVVQARVAQSVGDLELERILVQYARRYRFERVTDAGNQAGTITFTIVPQ